MGPSVLCLTLPHVYIYSSEGGHFSPLQIRFASVALPGPCMPLTTPMIALLSLLMQTILQWDNLFLHQVPLDGSLASALPFLAQPFGIFLLDLLPQNGHSFC